MSVEFRQRTAGEFARMLKRRKWLIFLPVLTMTAAIGYVVNQLPSVYESRTLLTVKPPTISEKVVQSLSSEDISQRLNTIKQEVLSRTTLEPMVAKYKLFELERNAGVPMELIVEKMQKNITVDVEKAENDKVAAFSLQYRDRSPEAARNVTAELAGKYVNAQIAASTQNAETTREFIDNNLNQAKQILDAKENERLQIMMKNVDTLPEAVQGLIAQRAGLQQREETISKEKESLMMQKGRLTDNIRALNSQARIIEDFGEKETKDAASAAARVEDTPAYVQLIGKRAELNSRLANLKLTLTDKHPEVIKAKNDIEKVNDEIQDLKKNTQKNIESATVSGSRKAELQKQNLEIERQKAESEITQIDQQMQMKEVELKQNAAQISAIDEKINASPNVKVALDSINTQYQSAKQTYDDLLKKKNDATLQVDRESNAQGETIRVQDPANLPSSPVAPKRGLLTLLGAAIGLALGLFLAAAFELPRILKIQNIEDAKHYTGLPVLASVPPLLTHDDKIWQKRLHLFKVAAGIAAAIGATPLIIFALQMSRVFERMIS
ncbi:MAG: Wzz/FepE/Etk N-terminal domain-containing protein [Acidobacteriota bacterium]|nr:Wzz/FepE/Etk N-terminal domain-containing protein [Acidobacteriota bacterium]